jgi:hypothetical protein
MVYILTFALNIVWHLKEGAADKLRKSGAWAPFLQIIKLESEGFKTDSSTSWCIMSICITRLNMNAPLLLVIHVHSLVYYICHPFNESHILVSLILYSDDMKSELLTHLFSTSVCILAKFFPQSLRYPSKKA